MNGNSMWNGKYGTDEMSRRAGYQRGDGFNPGGSQWGGAAPAPSPSGDLFSPRASGRQLKPPSPITPTTDPTNP